MDKVKETLGSVLENGTLICFGLLMLAVLSAAVCIAIKRTEYAWYVCGAILFLIVAVQVTKMVYEKMGWSNAIVEMEGN